MSTFQKLIEVLSKGLHESMGEDRDLFQRKSLTAASTLSLG